MISKDKGACAYLKAESPFGINIACICHEEASGIGEAVDEVADGLDDLLVRLNVPPAGTLDTVCLSH